MSKKLNDFLLKNGVYLLLFVIFTIIKFYIVSDNEILALNKPHDELWYINSASNAYWLAEYNHMAFIHLPAYPLFIFVVNLIGIPLRIAIEIFYIFSALCFCLVLFKVGLSKISTLFLYFLIIFNPISFNLFDHTLAEVFYSPLLMFSLSSIILLFVSKNKKYWFILSIIVGLSFSFLWFTRDENILIILFFVLILFVLIFFFTKKKISKTYFFEKIKFLFLIPILTIMSTIIFVYTLNFIFFKSFSASDLHNKNYKAAYNALQSIKTSKSIRYVPVTSEARHLAYEVSPTFKQLEPILEDDANWGYYWTKLEHNIDNEIASGWWYWVFRDAVYNSGSNTLDSSNHTYFQINKEINKAFKNNKLNKRISLFGFVDPNFLIYLSELPSSFLKITKLLLNYEFPKQKNDLNMPIELVNRVDDIANRRQNLVAISSSSQITGWVFSENETEIKEILLKDINNNIISTNTVFFERPDLLSMNIKKETSKKAGFSLTFDVDENNPISDIDFIFENSFYSIPLDKIVPNKVIEINDNVKKSKIYYAIDNFNIYKNNKESHMIVYIKKLIKNFYETFIPYITMLSGLSFIYLCLSYKQVKQNSLFLILIFLSFIVFSRLMLFAFLDTVAWNGDQQRYIFPVMSIFFSMLLISIELALKKFNKKT